MLSSCTVCGGDLNREAINYPHPNRGKSELIFNTIEICSECGFGMASPHYTQDELDRFYSSGAYWSDVVKENPFQDAHEKNQARLRVVQSMPYVKSHAAVNVLDVGAGHAHTMTWIEKLFPGKLHRFDFIEHDEDKCHYILSSRKAFTIRRLAEIREGVGYDLIFMNHVLEHVADPELFLSEVLKQLNPEGVIYVEIPHSDYRYKQDVFPHTLFFTQKSLARLADKLGVVQLHSETFGRDAGLERGVFQKVYIKVLSQLYYLSVRMNVEWAQQWLDRLLWQYQRRGGDRIWLRWIITPISS